MSEFERIKKEFYGKSIDVITDMGVITFAKEDMNEVKGIEGYSYNDFLQMQWNDKKRKNLASSYYSHDMCTFTGTVSKITKDKICFERLRVDAMYTDGMDGTTYDEEHVWTDKKPFIKRKIKVGDYISFGADIYPYVKKKSPPYIDFGIKNPFDIAKKDAYSIPTAEKYLEQDINHIICDIVCMFKDHCNGTFCLMDEKKKEKIANDLKNVAKHTCVQKEDPEDFANYTMEEIEEVVCKCITAITKDENERRKNIRNLNCFGCMFKDICEQQNEFVQSGIIQKCPLANPVDGEHRFFAELSKQFEKIIEEDYKKEFFYAPDVYFALNKTPLGMRKEIFRTEEEMKSVYESFQRKTDVCKNEK